MEWLLQRLNNTQYHNVTLCAQACKNIDPRTLSGLFDFGMIGYVLSAFFLFCLCWGHYLHENIEQRSAPNVIINFVPPKNEDYLVPYVFTDVEADPESSVCVICLTNKVATMNLPCACSVLCGTCSGELISNTNVCPTCRKEIKQIKIL